MRSKELSEAMAYGRGIGLNYPKDPVYVLAREVDALAAQLAKSERDAARYRWLVENTKHVPWSRQFHGLNADTGLDEAIDAAMAADSASVTEGEQ